MKRCKKMLSMVLCILMVLGIFAGCNQQVTVPVATIAPTEPTETEPEFVYNIVTDPPSEPTDPVNEETMAQYTIVYVINGGQMPENAQTAYTLATPVILPVPTKDNCIFRGWFEKEDCSGDVVLTTAGQTGDKTYYAKWEEFEEVDPDDEPTNSTETNATVTADILNIRERADANSARVGTYAKGDRIEILEKKGDWGRTDKGWVNLNYVKMDTTTSGIGGGTGATSNSNSNNITHIHEYKLVESVEENCYDDGYNAYECKCGEAYKEYIARSHKWGEWVIVREATDLEEGLQKRTCTECGVIDREKLTKLPHVHAYETTVIDPTCTEDGYTLYECVCGDIYTGAEFKATGHDYKAEVVEPTNDAEGYTLHTCKVCGDSYKDNYVDKLPESQPADPYDPPEIEGHTHVWGDWTQHEDGWKYRICPGCGNMDIAW